MSEKRKLKNTSNYKFIENITYKSKKTKKVNYKKIWRKTKKIYKEIEKGKEQMTIRQNLKSKSMAKKWHHERKYNKKKRKEKQTETDTTHNKNICRRN